MADIEFGWSTNAFITHLAALTPAGLHPFASFIVRLDELNVLVLRFATTNCPQVVVHAENEH